MSLPTTIASYEDCFDLFARAINQPKGSRALLGDYGSAKHFQSRMQMARKLQRDETCRMYDAGAPQYNKSEFDKLVVRIKQDADDQYWVYVEPYATLIATVEDIE